MTQCVDIQCDFTNQVQYFFILINSIQIFQIFIILNIFVHKSFLDLYTIYGMPFFYQLNFFNDRYLPFQL